MPAVPGGHRAQGEAAQHERERDRLHAAPAGNGARDLQGPLV